ncbi:hypothetical protein [Candidatus Darwinibacter acetoxidans]
MSWGGAPSYNYDPAYCLPFGNAGGIKVTGDEAYGETRISIIPMRHPDWVNDWTGFDTISAWLYLESEALQKVDYITGWNHVVIDFEELLVFESQGRKFDGRGELSNMGSTMFIAVYSEPHIVYYVDEIQLIKKHD